MPKRKPTKPKRSATGRPKPSRRPVSRPHFVGRDASPVLDRYPPKDPATAPKAPPPISLTSTSTAASTAPAGPLGTGGSPPLITLERPFDIDEFSTLLGETSIRVTVPRDALPEVLRRVTEFMGFGIYVYSISVKPAPTELLKSFVVELQRVDFSTEKQAWMPFEEKGTTDSPFGPGGNRT